MVRALLAGTKTQTRRVLRVQPHEDLAATVHYDRPTGGAMWGSIHGDHGVACPFGRSGDRLWVRENGWERRGASGTFEPYYYDATETESGQAYLREHAHRFRRRPSIHMPRWACRLVLEVTGVRVERLQGISFTDAKAEGFEPRYDLTELEEVHRDAARDWYMDLWDSLNAKRGYSWSLNPWVWVVEFRRVEQVKAAA